MIPTLFRCHVLPWGCSFSTAQARVRINGQGGMHVWALFKARPLLETHFGRPSLCRRNLAHLWQLTVGQRPYPGGGVTSSPGGEGSRGEAPPPAGMKIKASPWPHPHGPPGHWQ